MNIGEYSVHNKVVSWLLMVILIGFPLLLAVGVWTIYRVVKGWLALAGTPARRTRRKRVLNAAGRSGRTW